MFITRVRLIPKRDDLEAIIEQYGDVWDVHLIRENPNFCGTNKGSMVTGDTDGMH